MFIARRVCCRGLSRLQPTHAHQWICARHRTGHYASLASMPLFTHNNANLWVNHAAQVPRRCDSYFFGHTAARAAQGRSLFVCVARAPRWNGPAGTGAGVGRLHVAQQARSTPGVPTQPNAVGHTGACVCMCMCARARACVCVCVCARARVCVCRHVHCS